MKQYNIKQNLLNYKRIILFEILIILLYIILITLNRIGVIPQGVPFFFIGLNMLVFFKLAKYYNIRALNIHFKKYEEEKIKMGLRPSFKEFQNEYEFYCGFWTGMTEKHYKEHSKYDDINTKNFRHKSNICTFLLFLNTPIMFVLFPFLTVSR